MTQAFSLYGELTVRQNLELHAQLYHLPPDKIESRIKELLKRYDLESVVNAKPESLPLGIKQRLQLAVAVLHEPADSHPRRADFGRRSDRARRVLANADRPFPRRRRDDLPFHPFHERGGALRPHLADARGQGAGGRRAAGSGQGARQRFARGHASSAISPTRPASTAARRSRRRRRRGADRGRADRGAPKRFDLARLWAYARRETVELLRDPIRLAFALVGPIILMLAFGYGISFDIENLQTAAFDQDDTPAKPATARRIFRLALFLDAAADHVGGRSGAAAAERQHPDRRRSACRALAAIF